MSKIFSIFVLLFKLFSIVSSEVTLEREVIQTNGNSNDFRLNCGFDLKDNKKVVKRVDVLRDDTAFYSVEYTNKNNHQLYDYTGNCLID